MGRTREVELKVGRRSNDGIVSLSAYPPQLVQLSVRYKGERSASVLLTQDQIKALRDALAEYVEEDPQPETTTTWTKLNADPKKLFFPSSKLRKANAL